MMMKKLILLLEFTLFSTLILGNFSDPTQFDAAIAAYKSREYLKAYRLFNGIKVSEITDRVVLSSSEFYAADCLFQMKELNGAASSFESFIYKYPYSSFREEALYKLGTIYYALKDYRKSRDRLMILIIDYPKSEYIAPANYWIGEAFIAENKFSNAEDFLKDAISKKEYNNFADYAIYSLAYLYEKLKQYENAVKYYDEILAYYRGGELGPYAQLRIGVCYFNLKKYDNAVLELSDPLIKKLDQQQQVEAQYYLANAFVRLKEYKSAQDIYKLLLKDNDDKSMKEQIEYGLAWVNFQTQDYEAAFNLFDDLSKSAEDSISSKALFWSAESKRYLGKNDEALKIYELFIDKYPDNPLADRAKYIVGSVFYNENNVKNSQQLLLNAVNSNDRQTRLKAYILLGELKLNAQQFKEAEKYFTQGRENADEFPELKDRAELGLAAAEYYLNDYKTAVQILETIKRRSQNFEKDKVNFYLAESYFMLQNFNSALKNYNSISGTDSQIEKQMLYGKAFTYFNLKDFANAIYYFTSYIKKYPDAANVNDAKLRLADSYYGIKNFEKASEIYQQLFGKDKNLINNDFAYYQYAQSLYKAGRSNDAISEFMKLQRKFPRSKYADASQYVVGWIHFQQNNYSQAIENYDLLIKKYPKSNLIPIALYSIGDSYFNMEQYDNAIEFYNNVLQNYSNTPYVFDAVNGIQYSYVAKNQPEKAVDFIDSFLQSHPNSGFGDQILFKKGDIYYSIENFENAVNAYKEFISSYPRSKLIPNAYYWIGKSQENMKQYDNAIGSFNYVINNYLNTEAGVSAVIELANIYIDKKDFASAIQVLSDTESKIASSDKLPEILYMKGTAQVKNNNIPEAYDTFNQVITYYEGTIFAAKSKLELGILELGNSNYENAQMLLKEVSEKRKDDIGAKAQYYYGISLFQQDKITDAISAFVRVRSIFSAYDEWYTKSLLMLGDCYVKLKDINQAREMYKAVLSRHSRGELAQEARTKLRKL